MSERQPELVGSRLSEEGVLSEAEAAGQRALTENIPGHRPGEAAEEAARRLESERYGEPEPRWPEVIAKPRKRRFGRR